MNTYLASQVQEAASFEWHSHPQLEQLQHVTFEVQHPQCEEQQPDPLQQPQEEDEQDMIIYLAEVSQLSLEQQEHSGLQEQGEQWQWWWQQLQQEQQLEQWLWWQQCDIFFKLMIIYFNKKSKL